VKVIALCFAVKPCVVSNREFTLKGDKPTKPDEGRKSQQKNSNDFCTLCDINLKIKFSNFQKSSKYITMENLFKPSGRCEGRHYQSFAQKAA